MSNRNARQQIKTGEPLAENATTKVAATGVLSETVAGSILGRGPAPDPLLDDDLGTGELAPDL